MKQNQPTNQSKEKQKNNKNKKKTKAKATTRRSKATCSQFLVAAAAKWFCHDGLYSTRDHSPHVTHTNVAVSPEPS